MYLRRRTTSAGECRVRKFDLLSLAYLLEALNNLTISEAGVAKDSTARLEGLDDFVGLIAGEGEAGGLRSRFPFAAESCWAPEVMLYYRLSASIPVLGRMAVDNHGSMRGCYGPVCFVRMTIFCLPWGSVTFFCGEKPFMRLRTTSIPQLLTCIEF